ncbi:MAG: hypothetical protein L6V81_05470 [Clostridium sp.]|nr:MAG: hypothetical protein L6V81_05470 [Clostridium sp.]
MGYYSVLYFIVLNLLRIIIIRKTYDYKLLSAGYSEEEVKVIKNKFSDDKIDILLKGKSMIRMLYLFIKEKNTSYIIIYLNILNIRKKE